MKKITSVLTILFLSYNLFSQIISDSSKYSSWTDIGIGTYFSTDKMAGLSYLLNITYKEDRKLYSIKFNYFHELQMFESSDPVEKYGNIGVLYGRSIINKRIFNMSINGGIGILGGIIKGDYLNSTGGGFFLGTTKHYKEEILITPDIPIQLLIEFNITKSFGFGLNLYADINFKRSLFGFMYIFKIGSIR